MTRDHAVAKRLESQGETGVYRAQAQLLGVDLASEGSFVVPLGRELSHARVFSTRAVAAAAAFTEALRAAVQAGAVPTENIGSITLRPPLSLKDKQGHLIDESGLVPVTNCRRAHMEFRKLVGRALEELFRRGLLHPIALSCHPLPIAPGSHIDLHCHITVVMEKSDAEAVAAYLESILGAGRAWLSAVEDPTGSRDPIATAAYGPWSLLETDISELIKDDKNLAEFFRQTRGLRFNEALGPFRAYRQATKSKPGHTAQTGVEPEKACDAGPNGPASISEEAQPQPTVANPGVTTANQALGGDKHHKQGEPSAQEPTLIIHGVQKIWVGINLRLLVCVSGYQGWDHLTRTVDLTWHIQRAKQLAEAATHFLYDNPATPERSHHHAESTGTTEIALTETGTIEKSYTTRSTTSSGPTPPAPAPAPPETATPTTTALELGPEPTARASQTSTEVDSIEVTSPTDPKNHPGQTAADERMHAVPHTLAGTFDRRRRGSARPIHWSRMAGTKTDDIDWPAGPRRDCKDVDESFALLTARPPMHAEIHLWKLPANAARANQATVLHGVRRVLEFEFPKFKIMISPTPSPVDPQFFVEVGGIRAAADRAFWRRHIENVVGAAMHSATTRQMRIEQSTGCQNREGLLFHLLTRAG